LIHWKVGSFNVIIFQFYSQSFFQNFLSTSEVSCYNNTLLKICQERPSLPTHFLIKLTSYNTGSRSRNIDWSLNYGEHISCSNYVKYGSLYISASIIKFYLYFQALGSSARYSINARLHSKTLHKPSDDIPRILLDLLLLLSSVTRNQILIKTTSAPCSFDKRRLWHLRTCKWCIRIKTMYRKSL
jgi:hypothetical protein